MFEDLINTPKRYIDSTERFINTCPYCKVIGKAHGLATTKPKGFRDDRHIRKYICKVCQKIWHIIIFIEKEATKSV